MSEESDALPPEFAPEPLWYNLATDIGQVLHDEHGIPPQSARNIEELACALSSVEMLWWHSRTRQTNSSTMPLRSLEKLLKSTDTLQKMAKSPSLADADARRRLALAWAKLQGEPRRDCRRL
ncbi:hypothetical protein C4375_08545 [Devosia sp. I507]|nr:hypothetical protein C4375_08545 [Devosia sp. I507]